MSKSKVMVELVAEPVAGQGRPTRPSRRPQPNPPARRWPLIAALTACAVAGFAVTGIATTHGVGVLPNSVIYFMAAESLANHGTLEVLGRDGRPVRMTQFPPMYPILLSVGPATGFDVPAWARRLNAAFFSATLILAGYLIYLLTGSVLETILAAGLLLLSAHMLYLHSYATSEPTFLFFLLLAAWLLARYLVAGRRVDLVGAASATAVAFMTRYAGAAFVAAGCLILAMPSARSLGRRLRDVVVFGAIAGGPELAWIAINRVQAGTAVNRPMAFHPLGPGQIADAASTIESWFAPDGLPSWLKMSVAMLASAAVALLWVRRRRKGRAELQTVLAAWIVAYTTLLIVTVCLVDAATQLAGRILAPLFVMSLILAVGSLDRSTSKRVVLAMLFGSYLLQGWHWVGTARAEGLGYASESWRSSAVMESIRALPPDTPIYTSGWEAVHFLTGRDPVSLPWKINKFSLQKEPGYEAEMALMGTVLEHGGVLVFIRDLDRGFLPSEGELRSRYDLEVVVEGKEGVLLGAARHLTVYSPIHANVGQNPSHRRGLGAR